VYEAPHRLLARSDDQVHEGGGRGVRSGGPGLGGRFGLTVHGRGQLGRDTAALRAHWERALGAGIATLTGRPLLAPGDVRLVWYADVLDPASPSPPSCDDDDDDDAKASSPPARDDAGDVLQLLAGVTSAFFTSLYESIPEESRTSMRALVGDVLYLGDRWRRCVVEHRLASALDLAARERRPVVLVAHSLGSLVSYRYLRADRPPHGHSPHARQPVPAIHRYVTLGSMLGIPELQELLLGRAGPLALSARVRSWVNVRHDDDPFAVPLTDSTSSGRERSARRIRELVTRSTTSDPHDIVGYLRDPAAARAIAWAWCDAFEESHAHAPAACGDIRDVP
jgi:hypothetical protein